MIDQHGEELESDLIRFCNGTDLAWIWTGELSWRRLGVLVKFLPPESATKTALRNETPLDSIRKAAADSDYGPWSQTDMLLAAVIDLLAWLKWAKTKDGSEGKNAPEPYPRPGVARKAATAANVVNLDLFKYMRDHNGAVPAGYTATVMADDQGRG